MLLAVVVGWIGLLFIGSMFLGSPEDIEHELVLVRNENGEVTEFTKYGTTDADLEQLRDMPELETLNLWGSENITDAGLAHLKGLTNLDGLGLRGCEKITDAGLAQLKDLTNLETINLMGTHRTDPSQRND